jgi:hypothetical protein
MRFGLGDLNMSSSAKPNGFCGVIYNVIGINTGKKRRPDKVD